MPIETPKSVDKGRVQEEWTHAIDNLVQQIAEWTQDKKWTIHRQPRQINEAELGTYTVPDLAIDTPNGRLLIEVKARGAAEGAGRVELTAWPTLYRVLLLHRMGQPDWTIRTNSGISLRQPWSKETFLNLAEDLLAAA